MKVSIVIATVLLASFLHLETVLAQQTSPGSSTQSTREAYISDTDFFSLGMPGIEISFTEPDTVTIEQQGANFNRLIRKGEKQPVREGEKAVLVGYNIDTAYVFYDNKLYITSINRLVSEKAMKIREFVPAYKYRSEVGRLKAEKERNLRNRENQREQIIKKYGENMGKAVNERKVIIGMTKAMVTDSWGRPRNVSQQSDGEQWRYASGNLLYFKNGRLTSFRLSQ